MKGLKFMNSAGQNEERMMQFVRRDENTTDILVYGEIRERDMWDVLVGETGTRIGAFDFANALAQCNTPNINVRINSGGGDASCAIAIHNMLRNSGKHITTVIDGMACSSAATIFCAGDDRIMYSAGTFMIHPVWTRAEAGNAEYFRALADELDINTQPLYEIYMAVTGKSEKEIKDLVHGATGNGTWMTSRTALSYGFATEIRERENKNLTEECINALVEECEALRAKVNSLGSTPKHMTAWEKYINNKKKGN